MARKNPRDDLEFAIPTEHQSQAAVVDWARSKYKGPWEGALALLYAVRNGFGGVAAKAKAIREGLNAGIPDLCLPVSRGPFIGLYIEMKRQGGAVSETQDDKIERLRAEGHQVVVCYSAKDAIEVLKNYLSMERRTLS